MTTNFQLLGPAHSLILISVVALAAVLAFVQRSLPPGSPWLRRGVGWVMILDTLLYDSFLARHGQLSFPEHLPLELCDVSLLLILLSLFTLNKAIFDLAYYGALAGATMALLTPNLLEPFPSFGAIQFFVSHGLTVSGALYLVWAGLLRPRRWSVAKAMLGVNVYAAFVGGFDFFFKTNYMYLRAKPQNASLLTVLGPWPWYIVAAEGVALVVFTLLYLPFWRISRRANEKVKSPERGVRTFS